MIGIYKITNPEGKVYIGQSHDLNTRIKSYKTSSQMNKKLKASVDYFGYEKHITEVIEVCSSENINEREKYWQEFYNCVTDGLNCNIVNPDKNVLSGAPRKDDDKKRTQQFVIRLDVDEVENLGGRRTVYDILRKSVKLPIN